LLSLILYLKKPVLANTISAFPAFFAGLPALCDKHSVLFAIFIQKKGAPASAFPENLIAQIFLERFHAVAISYCD